MIVMVKICTSNGNHSNLKGHFDITGVLWYIIVLKKLLICKYFTTYLARWPTIKETCHVV